MTWRIYYGDGSTFSNKDGDPYNAPPVNAIVVVQDGKLMQGVGKDTWYWRPDIGWNLCDIAGMWDYLMLHRGPKMVLFGRSVRDEDFWSVMKRAVAERHET